MTTESFPSLIACLVQLTPSLASNNQVLIPLGENLLSEMRFRANHLTIVLWITIIVVYYDCLAEGKSTNGELIRKHVTEKVKDNSQKKFSLASSANVHAKLRDKSSEKGLTNGVRKDLLGALLPGCEGPGCMELPLPVQIEHIKDYPVPVPVRHETSKNVLHVHIHDSKFVCFYLEKKSVAIDTDSAGHGINVILVSSLTGTLLSTSIIFTNDCSYCALIYHYCCSTLYNSVYIAVYILHLTCKLLLL